MEFFSCIGGNRGCAGWTSGSQPSTLPISARTPRRDAPITSQVPRTESGLSQRSEPSSRAPVESLLRPISDEGDMINKNRETFWVSPSLASWLTGKRRGAEGCETVQSIIRNAVEKSGDFADKSIDTDESMPQSSRIRFDIAVDFRSSNHANWKKLIISGDPEKRKKAVATIKELTSRCQNETGASLIDTWQSFSDDQLKEDNATLLNSSPRGQPKFGLVSMESQIGEVNGSKDNDLKVPISTFRKNLVFMHSLRDREADIASTVRVPLQVLKLDFPQARLPLQISKRAFEAALKHWLDDVKQRTKTHHINVARVEANIDSGTHATAHISVHDGCLEDLRTVLLRHPPIVCNYEAVVPHKKIWCETCQQEHEVDKPCYKYFHIENRFDESLSAFIRGNL